MSASFFDILPQELKCKIFDLLCYTDKLHLFCFVTFRPLICNAITWKCVDFDTIEHVSLAIIEVLKAVSSQIEYLTWQIGTIWHYRKLSQTVGRFANLKELDLSGNMQISDITFLRGLKHLCALCLHCCYNVSADSTVNAVGHLQSLNWLDICECGQFSQWHVEQIVIRARNLMKFNICGTKGYTLHGIRRISAKAPGLQSLRFCALVDAQRVDIWRPILQEDYAGPLKMCSAMREIVMHYIVM